ncbi:hypothetical protein [Oceanicoccus sagamiensis]|uniref:Uncharacterized protein n=1 Tax=Oceanicoccus sagamiensis TaxID=716816 RepID=A0A1X9NE41_9GAMM|nr:hypothetical protein [Oceanicoccus sagamiensis]ARN75324.1 hypothetical protein BST96_15095 [Oceanicoccus sagamiensis]
MSELINEMNAQMAVLPAPVQYWMNWMMLVFVFSIVFVWKHKAARYVLLSLVLTMPVAQAVFYLSGTVHLLGIAHLLIWGPLFYYLYYVEIKPTGIAFNSPYAVWLLLLMVTIAISLIFDIRDVVLVAMGSK